MADVSTVLKSKLLNRVMEVTAFNMNDNFALANAIAANGDRIRLYEVTRNSRLIMAILAISATLGASATVQLQRDRAGVYTNLSPATTAGAASIVNSLTLGAFDLQEGDFVVLLVGGANIASAAVASLDLLVQSK